jgi:hypothetical protein
MPRAVHGDEWPTRHKHGGQVRFGGVGPQANAAFSLEEAPTFGRGSSLNSKINRGSLTIFHVGNDGRN